MRTQPDRQAVRDGSTAASAIPHTVLPLGGIGTGNLGLAADGGLRQVQLHNVGNHRGALPGTFLALRCTRIEPPLDVLRVLQATPGAPGPPTPLVTDDLVPDWQRDLVRHLPGVTATTYAGTYPFARIAYHDEELPLEVTTEAFTPLVPLDEERSALPAALLTVRLRNVDRHFLHGTLVASLQNAVGWDGTSPIDGVRGAGYGGNTNRVRRDGGWTGLVMDNPALPDDHPKAGQLSLSVDDPAAAVFARWRHPAELVAFLRSRGLASGRERVTRTTTDPSLFGPRAADGPSPAGETWNGAVAVRFALQPGESRDVRVLLTWWFPHRYVDAEQFGPPRPEWGRSRFWLGNHHTERYADAVAVADEVRRDWADLRAVSADWADLWNASSWDERTATHLAAQLSLVRSPTCFRSADGRFLGFEGTLGASSVMWAGEYGGSCPLNCTHVWNYEHAVARAFPVLERSMRDTEVDVMQAPSGALPHRLVVPTYLRQLWDEPIGGPEQPALDGMFGLVLKTYREVRNGAGEERLAHWWPAVVRLLDHVHATWDPAGTGLLHGIQPSTHDIDLAGANSFMGTLWLAALRAAEELAVRVGADGSAYRQRYERARTAYDEALWNGEYYEQVLEPGDPTDFQWGAGCLTDQLVGQWWAHELDLGHLLPVDHVRSALRAVVRHNLRTGFADLDHPYRVFADSDDTGLVLCSWPRGGRPAVPTRYADEVWTGCEYQVAAHCLREGLSEAAGRILDGVWSRYDGRRRNPYNEIECGDHYARAMAGWTVFDALTGFRYDATRRTLAFRPGADEVRWPWVAGTAWGGLTTTAGEARLEVRYGVLRLDSLRLDGLGWSGAQDRRAAMDDGALVVDLTGDAPLAAGDTLVLRRAEV